MISRIDSPKHILCVSLYVWNKRLSNTVWWENSLDGLGRPQLIYTQIFITEGIPLIEDPPCIPGEWRGSRATSFPPTIPGECLMKRLLGIRVDRSRIWGQTLHYVPVDRTKLFVYTLNSKFLRLKENTRWYHLWYQMSSHLVIFIYKETCFEISRYPQRNYV